MEDPGLLATPRLTPEHLRGWEIPRVLRGYDVQVVDGMRRAAADEISALITERDELAHELERTVQAVRHTPAHGMRAVPDVGEQAARILAAAQHQRESLLSNAQAYARQVGQDAETRARSLVDRARGDAEGLTRSILEEAHHQAAEILARAPLDAQERMTRVKALAAVWETSLRSFTGSLTATLDALDKELANPGILISAGSAGT